MTEPISSREWHLLCEQIASMTSRNNADHDKILTQMGDQRDMLHDDRERLVAIERDLQEVPIIRDRLRSIESEVVAIRQEMAVRKARLAGIGAAAGALVAGVVEVVRALLR